MDNGELHDILSDIKQRKSEGFEDLYSKYYKLMLGVAFCIVRNEHDCHDIIQQVMMKLYSLPEDKFPEKYDMSWLYTVVKNEALQFLRKNKTNTSFDELPEIPVNCSEMEEIIHMDYYNSIIKGLDGKSREIVTLKILCGMTHKEIASALKMSCGTVQWKYHMSVNSLKIAMTSICVLVINSILLGRVYLSRIYKARVVERTMLRNIDLTIDGNPLLNAFYCILIAISGFIFIKSIARYIRITRGAKKADK